MMQFPRLVFKSASIHKIVNDGDEYAAALDGDWFASVPDAIEGKRAPVNDSAPDRVPPTRAELLQKADELGIKFDGRWSDQRLSAEISHALKA